MSKSEPEGFNWLALYLPDKEGNYFFNCEDFLLLRRNLPVLKLKGLKGRLKMAKYGKKASKKVEKTMHERKKGTLKSGSGKKVTSKKQAIAIGLSEARKEGAKVPRKKSASKKK